MTVIARLTEAASPWNSLISGPVLVQHQKSKLEHFFDEYVTGRDVRGRRRIPDPRSGKYVEGTQKSKEVGQAPTSQRSVSK